MNRKNLLLAVAAVVAIFGALCCGYAVGNSGDKTPAAPAAATHPATTVTVSATAAAPSTAPATTKASPAAPKAVTVDDGVWTVGVDIPVGRYRTTANVSDGCYWAITKSGTNGETIIANDLPSGGRPSVTLKAGQDFDTERCGTWAKVG